MDTRIAQAVGPVTPTYADDERKVVYFPSCLNQTMGRGKGVEHDLVDTVVAFLNRAGWEVILPNDMKELCCGMIWESKGMPDVADRKLYDLEAALFEACDGGLWPVVCDQSPCLHRMRRVMRAVKPLELMEFIHDQVAPSLTFHPIDEPKGFTHPELNAYALRHLRQAIEEAGVKRGFSNSRTCEIGLTTHSGIPYQSLIYLIDEVTR